MKWFNRKKKVQPFEAALPDAGELRIDIYSPTWRYIEQWAEKNLGLLRESNDSPRRTEAETAVIRGKIRFCRDLLELPTEAGKPTLGILNRPSAGEEE